MGAEKNFDKIETDMKVVRKDLKDRLVYFARLDAAARAKGYKEDPNIAETLRLVIECSELAMNDREALDNGTIEKIG
jgi:hypothetical protein